MDALILLAPLVWWGMTHPGSVLAGISPRTTPTILAATWRVQQEPREHPWETRLRRVEASQARQDAVGDLAIKEAKEIIENRTKRIEELEKWKREQDRQRAEGEDPAAVAAAAKRTLESVEERTDAVVAKVEDANPWNALYVALGGSAGIAALLSGIVAYGVRRLRQELVENEALPGKVVAAPARDDDVSLGRATRDPGSLANLRNM